MTIDEELNLLDQQLRRLKIEYEIFFSNPTKRPPTDIEWKVLALLRKFSDGGRMSFSQRYRYNEMAQRYAIYSDLWRKKARIREEGYRRPQDALLSVQGVRIFEEGEEKPAEYEINATENGNLEEAAAAAAATSAAPWPAAAQPAPEAESTPSAEAPPVPVRPASAMAATPTAKAAPAPPKPVVVHASSLEKERKQIEALYRTLVDAKKKAGEQPGSASLDSFASFVKSKTSQIQKQYGCDGVEYSVEVEGGKVKLKAKAKTQ